MTNPLKYAVRRFALRKFRSEVSQSIIPLDSVKCAAVFVDGGLPGADAAETAVRSFFGSRGIAVLLLRPDGKQLNYAGYMRRKFRLPEGGRHEDLFVSLSDNPENFAAEFEARCSPARFKAGRIQLSGGIFDMIVSPPGDERADQAAVFGAISEYLLKIK